MKIKPSTGFELLWRISHEWIPSKSHNDSRHVRLWYVYTYVFGILQRLSRGYKYLCTNGMRMIMKSELAAFNEKGITGHISPAEGTTMMKNISDCTRIALHGTS